MQHLNDYKSFKNVITRIDKNLKKCSESLYDKFLNAINSDLKSNNILKEGEDFTSLKGTIDMVAAERMEFFKNEIRKEVSEKVREETRKEVATFLMNELQKNIL